ncbi:hypothetical protein [Paracidovorax wautersii]|uniref:hypothetical protein n=1 Tax=Paracidovorax wautersii TaxID=1177982 RepID=UPI0031D01983
MNDFVAGLIRWTLRLFVVVVGLVFFLSLVAAVAVLALAWGVRALWAQLTGRPVTPWTMRMDPREGWSTVYRSTARWTARGGRAEEPATPGARSRELPGARDVVVDVVEPREVR